jgi:hypothetical protein
MSALEATFWRINFYSLLFLKKQNVIDNARRLVTLVSEKTHAKLLNGEQIELKCILYVDVLRRFVQIRFLLEDFACGKKGVREVMMNSPRTR